MSRLPLLLLKPELRIQEFLLECETGVGVEVGIYDGGVLVSEFADLFPEKGIKIEVV